MVLPEREPRRRLPQRSNPREKERHLATRSSARIPSLQSGSPRIAGRIRTHGVPRTEALAVVRGWQRTEDGGAHEIVLAFVGPVTSMIVLRDFYPYKPHNDFRFCLAAVAPGAVLVASGFGVAHRRLVRRWPHLAALPGWLTVAFCSLSLRILFYWA
jgi:hypothetical protein